MCLLVMLSDWLAEPCLACAECVLEHAHQVHSNNIDGLSPADLWYLQYMLQCVQHSYASKRRTWFTWPQCCAAAGECSSSILNCT